jgi:hypothetical protein
MRVHSEMSADSAAEVTEDWQDIVESQLHLNWQWFRHIVHRSNDDVCRTLLFVQKETYKLRLVWL